MRFQIHLIWAFFRSWLSIFAMFLLVLSTPALAQQKVLDSLLAFDKNHEAFDTLKGRNYVQIMRQYFRLGNEKLALDYHKKAFNLSEKLKDHKNIGLLYMRTGSFYHNRSRYGEALSFYNKGIAYCKENRVDRSLAGIYLNVGALYKDIPDYPKSLTAHQNAIEVALRNNFEDILASSYYNISSVYLSLEMRVESYNYAQKALKTFLPEGEDSRGVISVYIGLADLYQTASDQELIAMGIAPKNRYAAALALLLKCDQNVDKVQDDDMPGQIKFEIADVYHLMGNNAAAEVYYEQALAWNKKVDYPNILSDNYVRYGKFMLGIGNFEKAETYLQEAYRISKTGDFLGVEKEALENLSLAYEKTNDFAKSFDYYKKFIIARDSLLNSENKREILRKELEIDFNIRENNYRLTQQITDAKLKQQLLLASQQTQALILNRQRLKLSEQQKSIQKLAFLKKQADLLNQKTTQENAFQQLKLKSTYEKSLQTKTIANQKNQITYDSKLKLYLSLLLAAICLGAVAIYYNQRKTSKLNKIIYNQKVELEQLGAVKDRIFSVVSHDMRTPVNALLSFTQLLDHGNISKEKLQLYSEQLKGQLTNTSAMMENILNWAASQMQGFNPYFERLNVKEIVAEVTASLHAQIVKKQLTVKEAVDIDAMAYADRNMVALIVRNLVSNAIKFTKIGGEIVVSSALRDDQLLIFIEDFGIGMDNQLVHQFNSPHFIQPEKSSLGTQNEKGTGLGLMLCKSFMQLLHGSISLESEVGKGSKFTVSLPA